MASLFDTVMFLIGVYWPFIAVSGLVGVVTGWLSLSRSRDEGAS